MIAIFSDTHSDRGHELHGAALEAARDAETVVHAGDFTSVAALEAFREVSTRLVAVSGNADAPAVCDRLPDERVLDVDGVRFAVTHRQPSGETGLAMFGRALEADVVVSGHTHRPSVTEANDVTLLNPGSHARPRGHRPGFGIVAERDGGLDGRLCEPDGTVIERFEVERKRH